MKINMRREKAKKHSTIGQFIKVCSLTAILLTASIFALAQTSGYTINGRVLDANDHPLANVDVALSGTQFGTVKTDAQGRFSFTGLAEGGNLTVTVNNTSFAFNSSSISFIGLSADQMVGVVGRQTAGLRFDQSN